MYAKRTKGAFCGFYVDEYTRRTRSLNILGDRPLFSVLHVKVPLVQECFHERSWRVCQNGTRLMGHDE